MFHRRYSNCRPQNSARYNRIICQTVENVSSLERLSCVLGTRLQKVTKVTNPISDFTFLSTTKSSKSQIRGRFLDSVKGTLSTHPKWSSFNILRPTDLINREGRLTVVYSHLWERLEGQWLRYLVPGLSTIVTVRQRATRMSEVQEQAKHSPFSHKP